MATALTPADRALNATDGKANFQRLTRLLVCGGITLLREVFDSIHPPAVLPIKLGDPTIKTKMQTLRNRNVLSRLEWNQLYPYPGVYGKSQDFDITLLFKLFRNIPGLTPPGTGWDSLPNAKDLSLEADLTRIKCYRNDVYAHSTTMEVSDSEFVDHWREISEALLRIAGRISNVIGFRWQKSIDAYLHNPLTPDAKRDIAELDFWYKNDMDVKDEVILLRSEIQQMKVEQLELKEKNNIVIHIFTEIFKPNTCGSSGSVSPIPNTLRPQEPQLYPGCVCIPVPTWKSLTEGAAVGQSSNTELHAKRQTPSTVLDFWQVVFSFKKSLGVLIEYLRTKLGLHVADSRLGSLLITVTCCSLEVLERLWEDYSSGHLSEVVQEKLVTPEVLTELDVSEVKLKTIILEDEYKTLRKVFKKSSVSDLSTDSGCNVEYRVPDSDDVDKIESREDEYMTHLSPKRPRPVRKNVSDLSTDSGCNVEYCVPDSGDADKIESRGDKNRDDDAEKVGEKTSAAFPSETKENSEDHSSIFSSPFASF